MGPKDELERRFDVRLDRSVIFVGPLLLPDLFVCLEGCEVDAAVGIEPVFVGGARTDELVRGCINFNGAAASAEKAFVLISRLALPGGKGAEQKT